MNGRLTGRYRLGLYWLKEFKMAGTNNQIQSNTAGLQAGNINISSANTISSTNTDGSIALIPNGLGSAIVGSSTQIAIGTAGSIFPYFQVHGTTGGSNSTFSAFSNTPGTVGNINFVKSRSTTPNGHTTVQDGDSLGTVSFLGDDGTDYLRSVWITGKVDGAVSTGIIPGLLQIQTRNTSGVQTTALIIDSSQNSTFSGNVIAETGNGFVSQSLTASMGSLGFVCEDNAGNYSNVLTNAATSDARTWTLPDASGTIALTSGASGIVNSGTQNQLAWYAATGTTVSGLATANNGILVTNGSGVPSIGNTVGASISVTGSVTATTGITTGISGTSSGTSTFFTSTLNSNIITQAKQVSTSAATNMYQITVPASVYFIAIKILIANSRAPVSNVGTSYFIERHFSIARNGSGSDVVLDALSGPDWISTSTTAGGAQNTISGATTIARNGAESNTSPQVVNITLNPATTGNANGNAAIMGTFLILGSLTGLSIS